MAIIPKLALIPSGYKAGKIYSVLPTSGVGDFDFTRNTIATRINSSGLIETVASGVPRLNYPLIDGVVNGCPSHLLEPERLQKIQYSEDFSKTAWVKLGAGTGSAAIVTSDYAISPDGTQNATRLQCDLNGGLTSSANQSLIYDSYTSSGNQSISIYVKSNTGSNQTIYFANTQTSGDTITVTSDWQRFEFSHSTATYIVAIGLRGRSGGSIDDTADILIYGAQVEQGSYATSYIPNFGNSAGATRVAETAIDGGAEAPIFSNTSAVWFINFSRFGYDSSINSAAITLNNSSNVEQIRFHFDQPTQTVRFRDAKNSFSNIGVSINTFSNIRKKVALKIDGTTLKVFSDGQQIGSDYTRPNAFDINSMDLQSSAFNLFETKFYNTALTDAELQALTQ